MSPFEFILVYVVCWWMVLFMVLPFGVRMADSPVQGHAPSAPANPRLKRKLLITSLIALLPPLLFLGIQQARATDPSMFRASSAPSASDCATSMADPDIAALDEDATLGGTQHGLDEVPTFLDAPASDYTNAGNISDELRSGIVQMGVVTTNTKTGETRLNGRRIGAGCE